MFGECNVCNDLSVFEANIGSELAEYDTLDLQWYSWDSIEGKQVKVVHEGTVEQCLDSLRERLQISFP
jgi:hypothetical protein